MSFLNFSFFSPMMSYIAAMLNIIYSDIMILSLHGAVVGFGEGVSGLADNKRFVSYMYQYKNDEKRNNIGYARVETRGNQGKVFIHIGFPEMEGKLLKAYMFYRKPAKYRFAYLGSILVDKGMGELKVKSDSGNVMNSDLAMEDMCGIIVYGNRALFAACEWDGEPVSHAIIDSIENLDLPHGSHQVIPDGKQESDVAAKREGITVVDYKGEPFAEEVAPTVEEEAPTAEIVAPTVEEVAPTGQEMAPMAEPEEVKMPEQVKTSEESGVEEPFLEEETKPYQNHIYYEEQKDGEERLYRNLVYEPEIHTESIDIHNSNMETCPTVDCIEPTYGVCGQGIEQVEVAARTMEGSNRFDCHPIAQNIFRKFQRVYPFEDNEISNCVRLEPQDIGLLPIDAWVLGNNSFLLHGYYTYRHLIFGNIMTQDGLVYIIGVPGIYQNRESFMARMFGFEYFKCAKRTEEKLGEFGYYYMPIQMG